MKLVIFGATGQTGQLLVKMALEHKHNVIAFVRNPGKLEISDKNLSIIKGDIFNKNDVHGVLQNLDAVVSCLGGEGNNKSTLLTDMTKNIVDCMKEIGIKRICYVATAGIYNEIPGFLINILISLMFKNVINDHKGAVEYIVDNNLDYTIARPLSLTNKELTKTFKRAELGVPKNGRNISRADLSYFLLESIEENKYFKKSIGLSY